jgi:hypothetical protein
MGMKRTVARHTFDPGDLEHYGLGMELRRWTAWTRVWLVLLALPLASPGGLPAFAHWMADAGQHVCACERSAQHSCGCPICEHRADLRSRIATVRGRCHDEDSFFGASLPPFVAPPPVLRVIRSEFTRLSLPTMMDSADEVFVTPPTPPPRRARS